MLNRASLFPMIYELTPLRRLILIGGGLSTLALVAYSSILSNTFLAEDFWQSRILSLSGWTQMAFFPRNGGYRPVMIVGWAIGNFVWGDQPFPYRIAVILLHLLNACLVFSIARRLTSSSSLGLLSGSLFLVFSPSAEAVNWLSAASNQVTCAFGYLIGLRAFISLSLAKSTASSRKYFGLCLFGLLIALGSNEMGLTWPMAALVLSAAVGGPSSRIFPINGFLQLRRFGSEWLKWTKRQLHLMRGILAVWALFIIWRTIAVNGIGGYGADVHLRAGWFLLDNLGIYALYFFQPTIDAIRGLGGAVVLDFWLKNTIPAAVLSVAVLAALWPARLQLLLTLILLLPAWNIPALHRGYMVGIGVALMVSVAIRGYSSSDFSRGTLGLRRVLFGGVAVALVVTQIQGSAARNTLWLAAGNWSRRILSETRMLAPAPANGTQFYYFGLPTAHNGINVFSWGLPEAIESYYSDGTLHAYQVRSTPIPNRVRNRLEASLSDIERDVDKPQLFFVYQSNQSGVDAAAIRRVTREEFSQLVRSGRP
jgi:hypothetical protein